MCLRIGKLHIKCLASRAAKQSDRPYTAMISSGSQRGKRARQHNNGLCSGVRGAPGEIRTPDPQIRSLVLYPAELRARRVLAIGFAAYWQAPAAAGRRGSWRTGAVAAGIAARMTGRRCKIFLGRGLFAKALAESVDEKSDDKKEADPADNSRRKHCRLSLADFLNRGRGRRGGRSVRRRGRGW